MKSKFVILTAAIFGFVGCAPKVGENTGNQTIPVEQSTVSKYEEFVKKNQVYVPAAVKAGVSLVMSQLGEKEQAEFARWGWVISNGIYSFTTGLVPDLSDVELMISKMGGDAPELEKYNGLAQALTGLLKIKLDEVKQSFNGESRATIDLLTLFADSLRAELKPYLVAE